MTPAALVLLIAPVPALWEEGLSPETSGEVWAAFDRVVGRELGALVNTAGQEAARASVGPLQGVYRSFNDALSAARALAGPELIWEESARFGVFVIDEGTGPFHYFNMGLTLQPNPTRNRFWVVEEDTTAERLYNPGRDVKAAVKLADETLLQRETRPRLWAFRFGTKTKLTHIPPFGLELLGAGSE